MPVEVNGVEYRSVSEAAETLGVSRQSLWRWRQEGRIPSGQKFRGKLVVFSPDEYAAIEEYANRIEPVEPVLANQLPLFDGDSGRKS